MTTHARIASHAGARPAAMLSYDDTMQIGATRYSDALAALDAAGLPGQFTQTGGMNAALLVHLDGGRVLLITDADDALSWDRADQQGWGVGLYRDETLDGGAEEFDTCDETDPRSLVTLAHRVLARFARSRCTPPRRMPAPEHTAEVHQ